MNYKQFIDKYNLKEADCIKRYDKNPILKASDIPYEAHLIFNAGVTKWKDEYLMAFRNDYYYQGAKKTQFHTNIGFATSKDGIHFTPFKEPFVDSTKLFDGEIKRFYDPRLTVIDNELYMTFAVDTMHGIRGGIMKIHDDLKTYELISMSVPDNRNMVLFPEKINGMYARLERPMPIYSRGEERFDMWISYSKDLKYWGESKLVIGVEDVPFSNAKIGPAAPAIKTDKGWLELFHAVIIDNELEKNGYEDKWCKVYFTGAALLDLKDPSKVLGICKDPIILPSSKEELENGFRNNVVFPCALIAEGDEVKIYYGAADTVTNLAFASLNRIIDLCLNKK